MRYACPSGSLWPMKFMQPLIKARLIRRYKRFLADMELADGAMVTVHTSNTGSMKGCCAPGSHAWLSDSGSDTRKYPLSWELVEADHGTLTGINTSWPNKLVHEAIENGTIAELQGYQLIRHEVNYGHERSRIDLLLEDHAKGLCYVEVKNVTLVEDGLAMFPDAVSTRGSKHLRELAAMVAEGHRAVIIYCIQRGDAHVLSSADAIDPVYGRTLREAMAAGVEALAYRADVSPESIVLKQRIPIKT